MGYSERSEESIFETACPVWMLHTTSVGGTVLTLSRGDIPLLAKKERDVSATPKQGEVSGKALRSMLLKSRIS
ncbi:MAG: hypothetical protein HY22_10380 [[Candidatus Thermochlorobacteriaceae] bacterium GBChlB]|nr:MAG: hypothetical protein HY22_10380 [[Candidatus Thermochlorobacteriaceae] bacterium GBChlB]